MASDQDPPELEVLSALHPGTMASDQNSKKTEAYSNHAYFEMILKSKLYKTVPDKVMRNPKFWDFIESELYEHTRENIADCILRRNMGEDATNPNQIPADKMDPEIAKIVEAGERVLQELGEKVEAEYESILKGRKFQYLKVLICGVVNEEDAWVDEDAEEDKGEFEARPIEGWEWNESDSEAEQEEAERERAKRQRTS